MVRMRVVLTCCCIAIYAPACLVFELLNVVPVLHLDKMQMCNPTVKNERKSDLNKVRYLLAAAGVLICIDVHAA
jgi:hypothetical protein